MATPLSVANRFIELAHANNESISNMKLQKLVYFAQGFYAALNNGAPLFEENFEAWKYGPVMPQLYHKFKVYFAGTIPAQHPFQTSDDLTENESKVVDWVFSNLGNLSAMRLSDISHKTGSPWYLVYHGTQREKFIPVSTLTEYFSQFVKSKTATAAQANL